MSGLEILETGPLSLIQDLGRTGHLRSGVGVAGAADRRSLKLGNRLVGNTENAAGIEILMGGFSFRANQLTTLAFTGAPAQAYLDGTPVGHSSVVVAKPGQVVRLDYAPRGLRTYLSVRGGIAVPEVLGSRSTDTLSGIGPAPVKPNDVFPIGATPATFPLVDMAPVPPISVGTLDIRVKFGPRAERFLNPGILTAGRWTISTDSDRIGARLNRAGAGPLLQRADGLELPTEGVALGSIQVPPSGQPVIFLADHPITGGYPVVGVVTDADIDRLGQARPGQQIQFIGA